MHRRAAMRLAGLSGLNWLTPLATCLARQEQRFDGPAKSVILLWLEGGPSQLETFDPHPDTEIAAGSRARKTRVDGVLLGEGLEQLADQMDSLSIVRALTVEEGDHERAIYNVKTGYRPDPTLVHPALGSVICHQFQAVDTDMVDVPRHVSILPGSFPGRGGYLGDNLDAFRLGDPIHELPDMKAQVSQERQTQRLKDLERLNQKFSAGRFKSPGARGLPEVGNLQAALRMMTAQQLAAFDVSGVADSHRLKYGDTPFGRGCLAALQLIQSGVRCVEVTLSGWDTHVDNHQLHAQQIKILDPAFASLISDLKERELLSSTIVLCAGEFGRTPWLNALEGRDHWPHGFAAAIAGGGIRGGIAVGRSSSYPQRDRPDPKADLEAARPVEDLHATVLNLLGVDYQSELITPIGRPMKLSQGTPIKELLQSKQQPNS
jgi:HAMP domain-containing protein